MNPYSKKQSLKRTSKKITAKNFYKTGAWKAFRRFIMLYYSKNGVLFCSTCGKEMQLGTKECHLGHYVKVFNGNSSNFSTAFHECNVLPQCSHCNTKRGGMMAEMAFAINQKFGSGTTDKLYLLSKKPLKLDEYYLDKKQKEYESKINSLLGIEK